MKHLAAESEFPVCVSFDECRSLGAQPIRFREVTVAISQQKRLSGINCTSSRVDFVGLARSI
jgi:hypothetical protein